MVLTPESNMKKVKEQIISDAELDNPENGILIELEVNELGSFTSMLDKFETT